MTPTLEKRVHTSARAFVRALDRRPLGEVWAHIGWPGDHVECTLIARRVGSSWTMRWHLGDVCVENAVSHSYVKREDLLNDPEKAVRDLESCARAALTRLLAASHGDGATASGA